MLTDEKHRLIEQIIGVNVVEARFTGTTEKEQVGRCFIKPGDLFKDLADNLATRVIVGKIVGEHRDGTADCSQGVFNLVSDAR